MPDDWREFTVEEIAAPVPNALATGPFGSAISAKFFQSSGVPVLRGGNLTASVDNRLREDDLVFVSREKAAEFVRSVARRGDLVFTCWGTIGQVGLIDSRSRYDEYIVSNKQMKLTPNRELADSLFLYYMFLSSSVAEQITSQAIGSSVPGFNLGQLRSIRLRLPPVALQRKIAGILGTLDDKIELNRQTNETLEAMARALYKSWFVDFDPVRAKAEGHAPGGMDADTAKLFPSELVDSELGPKPKGWRVAPLQEYVEALSGGTPSKGNAALWAGTVPWISPKVMTSIHADEADAFVARAAIGNGTRLAPPGSTLVMVRGMALHQEVRVSQARAEVTFNQDVKALVPTGIDADLLLFAMLETQEYLLSRVESSGHGTGRLPSDVLLSQTLVMPPPGVQEQLARPFATINMRIAELRAEARTLGAIRDALLPKLVTGERSAGA